jgi:predicted phosphodiesterase
MKFAFDLISDLHIESWPNFDWQGQATSPFCVVAGDVARDPTVLQQTLEHLAGCYQSVFYIDGNDEHRWFLDDIGSNYRQINDITDNIPKVVYLQDNVAVVNGVAILGTNGWWSWDFDPTIPVEDCQQWFLDYVKCGSTVPDTVTALANSDAAYLKHSISKLQRHPEVKSIVVVTHTVPHERFVNHDLDLVGNYRYNCLGNSLLEQALSVDLEQKISHWCFGHYHGDVDQTINGIRYVNNCRGRGDTSWKKSVYYPRRIEIDV